MEPQTINADQEPKKKAGSDVDTILSLENLIKSHYSNIEKLKEQKKAKAEMLKSAYESDARYHELDETAKAARKEATELKGQILLLPSNQAMKAEVADLQSEIRESQLSLSDYLKEYSRLSGATQLELFPGEFADILMTAKLKRAKSKR